MSRHVISQLIALTALGAIACGGDEFTPGAGAAGSSGAAGTADKPSVAGAAGDSSAAGAVNGGSSQAGGGASAGGLPSADGPPLGGAPTTGGGPPVSGAPPQAGGGAGGMSSECSSAPDCQKCCDERFPDAHGPFASKFYSCGCGACGGPCGSTFCTDAYSWNEECLSCVREEIADTCSDAAVECNASAECEDFAMCSFSCL